MDRPDVAGMSQTTSTPKIIAYVLSLFQLSNISGIQSTPARKYVQLNLLLFCACESCAGSQTVPIAQSEPLEDNTAADYVITVLRLHNSLIRIMVLFNEICNSCNRSISKEVPY